MPALITFIAITARALSLSLSLSLCCVIIYHKRRRSVHSKTPKTTKTYEKNFGIIKI